MAACSNSSTQVLKLVTGACVATLLSLLHLWPGVICDWVAKSGRATLDTAYSRSTLLLCAGTVSLGEMREKRQINCCCNPPKCRGTVRRASLRNWYCYKHNTNEGRERLPRRKPACLSCLSCLPTYLGVFLPFLFPSRSPDAHAAWIHDMAVSVHE